MKQLIPIFSLAILMTACTSHPDSSAPTSATPQVQQAPVYNADTVGLAQFQQWKVTHELAAATEYKAPVQNSTATPVKKISKTYEAPSPQSHTNSTASAGSASSTVPGSTDGGAMNSEASNTAKAPVKKGISKTIKGTAIGAGVGAAAGAVINKKNRVLGGVIGGVLGGAVGYGIGHHMDKQDNQPQYVSY